MADYVTKEELLEKLSRLKTNFYTFFTFQGTGLIAKDTSTSPATEYKHSNINFVFASDQGANDKSLFYLYHNPLDEQNTYAIDGINQPTDVSILGEYRLAKGTDVYENDGIARFSFTSQIDQGGTESDENYRGFTRIQSVEKVVGDKTYYPFITYISMPVFDNISDGVTYSDAVSDYLNNPTDAKLAVVETALENALNPHRPVYEKGNGGGAGQMGGGSGYDTGGAGGGSSYIGNYMLYEKAMYGYDVQESDLANTKTISTKEVSENNIAKYAKKGNGFARITFLGAPNEEIDPEVPEEPDNGNG